MIFTSQMPPAVLFTWIQLRALAWDGWVTPVLSMQELSVITGKSQAVLHRHISQLRHLNALSWRTTESGSIIVSFEDEPSEQIKHNKKPPLVVDLKIPDSKILDSENIESHYPPSYFPHQVLGYLSIQEDEE